MSRRAPATAALGLLLAGLAAGCDAHSGIPPGDPDARPPDGLLQRPELQELVDLQVARDGTGLAARLADSDPAVRARAAFALGAVRDTAMVPALLRALADPDAGVRRDAAFALGQAGSPAAVGPLAAALAAEAEPDVRLRIVGALAKLPSTEAVDALLGMEVAPGEEAARTLAVARLGAVVGVAHPGAVEHLLGLLDHPDPDVRVAAAYYFGRQPDPTVWRDQAARVRQALDGLALDDPAAMYLTQGLGNVRSIFDGERLRRWASEATDWRIRTNATAALAGRELADETQAVLFAGLDDPSIHVAATAAEVLARGNHVPSTVARVRAWVEANPRRLPAVGPLLVLLARMGEREAVLGWVDALALDDGAGWRVGLPALGFLGGADVLARLERAAGSPVEGVSARALGALAQRWTRDAEDPRTWGTYFGIFRRAVEGGSPDAVAVAAPLLADSAFASFGAAAVLAGARPRVEDAAETRAGAREPGEPPRVDWAYLAEVGASPRLVLETGHGTVVIRLATEEAPLTVQTVARLAEAGRYDGVPFHRVVPNFVVQGGDVSRGDGTGGPGFAIRTEPGLLRFVRGAIGMASAGRDTEGSQFFVTHVMTPHLDGAYTAFGIVEAGMEVVDRIARDEPLLRARIERGR